jgi:hypothetical protein
MIYLNQLGNQLANCLNNAIPPAIKDGKTDHELIDKRMLKIALTMLGSLGLSLAPIAAGYVLTGVSIAVIGFTLPAIGMVVYPHFEAWRTQGKN